MASVWLGHDELLDRPVAVKILADTIASDPGFVARFRREAHTAAGLSHPNLVRVYDFSDEEERPYLVMELVPGEDLAGILRRRRPVDSERLARELLEALIHIHAVGILHRDIKPGNVIVEPDGTAKLIDFGIALPRDATALTQTGLVLGTERYAAPEVMEGEPATERSDLYSCGVLLQSCGAAASPSLQRLVGSLVSRDPRGRPLSAAGALAELERNATPAPGQATEVFRPISLLEPTEAFRPSIVHGPTVSRSTPRPRRAFKLGAAAVAGLIILVAAAVVALGGGGDHQSGAGDRVARGSDGSGHRPERKAAKRRVESPQPAGSPVAVDPERGAALNEEGFTMLQGGDYAAAVPVLEEAVASFPPGTQDLDYAYALFNLGEALRLTGRPREAIPILERRLRIPDQESEVRRALDAAYAEAGKSPPGG
jgi:serine/threonine-protein kinase